MERATPRSCSPSSARPASRRDARGAQAVGGAAADGRDRQGARRRRRGSSRWTSRPRRWPTTRSRCSTASCAGSRARGIAILYVSHRMPRSSTLADRITVLKDGALGHHAAPPPSSTPPTLVRLMVGRPLGAYYPPRATELGDVAAGGARRGSARDQRDRPRRCAPARSSASPGCRARAAPSWLRAIFGADPFTAARCCWTVSRSA